MKEINITISEVQDAAQNNADTKYIERARGIAASAFVDGATWAIHEIMKKEGRSCSQL